MKKKLLSMLVASAVLIACSVQCFAVTQGESDYDINSVREVKAEVDEAYDDGKLTKKEQKSILKDTDPEVLADYVEEVNDSLDEAIENEDIDIDEIMNKGGSITLYGDNHSKVILEFEDGEDKTFLGDISSAIVPVAYAAENGETKWKGYGNRYFTAKETRMLAAGYVTYKLENHYILSDKGIDENYGVQRDSAISYGGSVSQNGVTITDWIARTKGKSDVNMQGSWSWQIGKTSGTFILKTTVAFLNIDKSDEKVKVKHSWSGEG